jgi:ribosomal protein S18 acetylase RimI-like enzyme
MHFNSSDVDICLATKKDVDALFLLVNSAYRGDTSRKGWTTEADLLDDLRVSHDDLLGMFENPALSFLKYSKDAEIQGSVCLENKLNHLYLGMLTVNPYLQDRGIGAKLLKGAEEFCLYLGLKKIRMTVISVRTELVAYYLRKGYVFTGEKEPFPSSETLEFLVLEKIIKT